jgi:hypothetical protein
MEEKNSSPNKDNLDEQSKNAYEYGWLFMKLAFFIPFFGILFVKIFRINFEELGPFGDFLAGTTVPFLTLSSFMLIAATLLMQQHQLKLQKEELQLTREEYSKTNEAFEEQNKTLSIQRFENTFFQMVSLHNDILKSMSIGKTEGRKLFYYLHNEQESKYKAYKKYLLNITDLDEKEINENLHIQSILIRISYNSIFGRHQDTIGHYFRNLYRIIKFIKDNKFINDVEKRTYIGIIRAQLSSYEQALLLYNLLSKYGYEKFLPLVKEYRLLEGLDAEILIQENHMEVFVNSEELYEKDNSYLKKHFKEAEEGEDDNFLTFFMDYWQ